MQCNLFLGLEAARCQYIDEILESFSAGLFS